MSAPVLEVLDQRRRAEQGAEADFAAVDAPRLAKRVVVGPLARHVEQRISGHQSLDRRADERTGAQASLAHGVSELVQGSGGSWHGSTPQFAKGSLAAATRASANRRSTSAGK